jgi:hypothetical protein
VARVPVSLIGRRDISDLCATSALLFAQPVLLDLTARFLMKAYGGVDV